MNTPTYTEKVPEKIRADNDSKLAGYNTEIEENLKQLKLMETLNN